MNPEGRKTPKTGANIDERIQKSIEARDHTTASQSGVGQTKKITSAQNQTENQEKLTCLKVKLDALKQKNLSPNTQTSNIPTASSGPSPS